MRDWEEQRELFPKRLRRAQRPPARLRPNIFARIARYCIARPSFVLLIAAFLITVSLTLAALGTRFDLSRSIEIPVDLKTQSEQARYRADFPTASSLMIVRVSAENSTLAQNAAQLVAGRLRAKKTNIRDVFTPGLGPFYDRFGFLYLDPAELQTRVERVKRLSPLFQGIAASPNLAGLSTLIKQVAEVVQNGRSPQGLETLFGQMSVTIKNLASDKPAPMDWRRVAGLRIDPKNTEWVVVVSPQPNRLQETRVELETLTASLLKSRPSLKITSDVPPEARAKVAGSTGRVRIVSLLLSVVFFLLLVVTTLRNVPTIIFFAGPPLVALATGFATASLVAPALDQTTATLAFAVLLPAMGFSIPLVEALRKPEKVGSNRSLVMLAAHETGPLLVTLAGMVWVAWMLSAILSFASLARLSVIVISAALAGLVAALTLVPALASLISKPQEETPADFYDRATTQNIHAIWRKLRPPITVLVMAVSLFCIVFFSSLGFSTARLGISDVESFTANRGLQFIAEGETAAAKLVNDLQQIPEVGSVRWMGSFFPQQVEQKQEILRGLAGTLTGASATGAIGPHDLIENLRSIELALRVIADEAGTDEGLRASAHEMRRFLAVLINTSKTLEQTAVELERLFFSGFGELEKASNDLSRLAAPQNSDFDPNLRALYVSEGDKWRLEVLPRRAITAKAFIEATKIIGATPQGPLMVEQAELRTLAAKSKASLAFGFVFILLIALAFLRNILDWLIVVLASLLLLPLYAAFVVTTGTAISPLTIPALIMVSLFGVTMAMLLVARKWQPQITLLTILLPAAAIIAIVLPFRLLHLPEFAAFTNTLLMLLIGAIVFNLTVVPQLCAWADGWRSSGPRQGEARVAAQPREDFGDDVF